MSFRLKLGKIIATRPAFRILPAILLLSLTESVAISDEFHFLENGNPSLRGSDTGYLLDTPTRLKIDLAGEWNYAVEGGPAGNVKVPSAFDFTGKVSFERSFEVPFEKLDNYQFSLVFFGINYNAEVWVNGEYIGSHTGGYTSFVQPLPNEYLVIGKENTIRVVVSNELDPRRTLPLRPRVWEGRNYGGILRDAFILATPVLNIRDVVAESDFPANMTTAAIRVRAMIEGDMQVPAGIAAQTKFAPVPGFFFEMLEKVSGTSVARSPVVPLVRNGKAWGEAHAGLALSDPKLWTPDTPDLYILKCYLVWIVGKETSTVIDEFDADFGIRRLSVAGGDILLNGGRLVLKGVVWREDSPEWGSALSYEQQEKDVVAIKNLGANSIRFAGHPPHPYMLNLCDRYGLLALEELPVIETPGAVLADEAYVDLASGMMREMVIRDRNHPSVLAWGIGDGFDSSSPAGREFVAAVGRRARELDARPLYYVSNMIDRDSCADLVDIAAIAVRSDDVKLFRSRLERWQGRRQSQPVVIAGIGTQVQPENRNGYNDPLSQEAQARYCLQRLEVFKSLDFDGAFVSSFNDWKSDRPALTAASGDSRTCTTGLVSERREKRIAYDAVRSFFHGERFVGLPAGTHSANAPVVYVLAGLIVLIGGAYFYNASRRFRESVNRSLLSSYNFFADVRDQHSVSLVHTTILGIIIAIATAIVTSSILYHFCDSLVMDNMLSFLLVSDRLKAAVIREIRNPIKFILYASAICFVLLLLISVGVLMLRTLFRPRIFPFHAYTVTMWSTPPLLLLVPMGMIIYRVMESSVYVLPSIGLVALLLFWVYLRLLKGISILFDVFPLKIYFGGILAVLVVAGALWFYYDYTVSLPMYAAFMSHSAGAIP